MGITIDAAGHVRYQGQKKVIVECPLEVSAGELVTADLADGAVTVAKLATDAVETAKIKDLNVTTGKLAAGAVTSAKITAGNVTATELGTGAVTTTKILAGNVTLPKISFTGLKVISTAGVDASGAPADITVSGPVAGDRVVAVFGTATAGGALVAYIPGTTVEATIGVTGKISQLITDLSASTLLFILAPATA